MTRTAEAHLLPAQRDGVLKQGPDHGLGAAGGGQGALVAVVARQILLLRDQLLQGDRSQSRVGVCRDKNGGAAQRTSSLLGGQKVSNVLELRMLRSALMMGSYFLFVLADIWKRKSQVHLNAS